MTLLYLQGFEGFDEAGNRTDFDVEFDFVDDVTAGEAAIHDGAIGGKSGWITNGNVTETSFWLPVAGLSSQDDWIVGVRFRTTYNYYRQTTSTNIPVLQFIDAVSLGQFSIIPISGTLIARSGASTGTILGIADVSITTHVWHFLEVKVNLHATTGSLTIRLNEEEILSLTNVNTVGSSAFTRPAQIRFGNAGNDVNTEIDDIYICDDQGSVNNDFLGDLAVRRYSPNGVGNSEQFTPSTAVDNYTTLDESNPDTADYVESNTATEKDTYTFEDIADDPATLVGVALKSYVQKTDGGSRNFVHVARSGTTEEDSAVIYPSAATYRWLSSIYEEDPDAAAAWDKTSFNAAEFGFKVNA